MPLPSALLPLFPASGSGSGFIHCRDHFGHFCNGAGRAQCKSKLYLKGMVCTVRHFTFTVFKNLAKTHFFLPTAYVWEAAPCSPLPTADENAVQNFLWPPCLPACSSQPQFLQRTCSYDAYCLCPPWSLFHVFFRVWTWLTWWARFLSGLSCALTSVSILRDMTTMELPSLRGCWSHMSVCLRQCQTETIIASENHTHTHTHI